MAPDSDQPPRPSLGSLYRGLKAIWSNEFPKTCPKCGRIYESFEEYLVDTLPLDEEGSGLMGYNVVGANEEQVGLFRNCGACGTTIMAFCHDRRDLSDEGLQRRHLFGELMNRLIDAGISAQEARLKLLEALKTPNGITKIDELLGEDSSTNAP